MAHGYALGYKLSENESEIRKNQSDTDYGNGVQRSFGNGGDANVVY